MSRKRWIALGAFAVAIPLLVVGALHFLSSERRVTRENLARVKLGMSRAQIENILGDSADGIGPKQHWIGDDGDETLIVTIEFDDDGRAIDSSLAIVRLNFLPRLLRRLGLRIL